MMRFMCLVVLGACLLSLVAGCTPTRLEQHRLETWDPAGTWARVEPWQRGDLASDVMRPDFNPDAERDWNHIFFSKEASHAEIGAGGGGCGCN